MQVVQPCNLERMIKNAQKLFHINKRAPTDLSPLRVVEGVREMLRNCNIVSGEDGFSLRANDSATFCFQCLARSTLCSKKVAEEYKLTTESFNWLLGEIEARFHQAIVSIHYNPESYKVK